MNEKESKIFAFDLLSKIENVRILGSNEINDLGFQPDIEIWEIDTEILFDNQCFPILFYLSFGDNFPLCIPRIFLSQDTFDRIKYIPHIDNNRFVCTYDPDIVTTNPLDPFGIIVQCLYRAKKIIVDGLNKVNHKDFLSEFKAYWKERYNNEQPPINVLSLINEINDNDALKLTCLDTPINNYYYVLHKSDTLSEQFMNFLKVNKFTFSEVSIFYLRNFIFDNPPFYYRNKDILDLIEKHNNTQCNDFIKFIDKKEYPKVVICKKIIEEKEFVFGWFHNKLNTSGKGFRDGKLKPFVSYRTTQSNELVSRLSTDILTTERIEKRTSGTSHIRKYSFSIAGLGSIGSNLIHFLNSFSFPELHLIDTDKLKLENIGRHLLGFSYIDCFKTIALKIYLESSNPLQIVSTKEKSIISIVQEEPNFINQTDYLFVCIGKINIELWLCQSIKNKTLSKPTFIIWVEPFLCGGHCLYLHPLNPDFEKYFDDGLFINNIISNDIYKKDLFELSLREAGCQTTYIPYSSNNVISFLSNLFPSICAIIETGSTKSTSFTWLGDINKLKELNISTSNIVNKFKNVRFIENTL